jgi:hypothetical protein
MNSEIFSTLSPQLRRKIARLLAVHVEYLPIRKRGLLLTLVTERIF